MNLTKTTDSIPRPSLLRRLDYIPTWLAVLLGVGGGALVGGALALASPVVGVVGFVVLLVGAVMLAFSGEPITVLARESKPKPVSPGPGDEAESVETGPPEVDVVVKPEMVKIPAGSFFMGSPDDEKGREDNEGPVHEVSVSAFECMRFPVTRRLYKELMGKDPGRPEGEADERPVNNVSWYDAVQFCNQLSEREGLALCYVVEEGESVSWNHSANGYRLPTEAEWEYACRAGTRTRWSCGDDERELERYAWFDVNSNGLLHPVGWKEPNAWGLHDMHGNVWEWCWDWYGSYPDGSQRNPVGPSDGDMRVLRGGAFVVSARVLRSALRFRDRPGDWSWFNGFRCVRGPRRQL